MLSRVAERMYWAARYLERAENTARLVRVYDAALLDLPEQAGVGWPILVDICGDELLRRFAGASPRRRHEVLSGVVQHAQQLTGLLSGTMSHGDAYSFICLGRNLERADMTTRIIDVAAATLLRSAVSEARLDNTLWMAVLKSLSGYQMYRQYVRRRIRDEDVIRFLLGDTLFPRAVTHCLIELEAAMRGLPNHEGPLRAVLRLQRMVDAQQPEAIEEAALRRLMDELQLELAGIHGQVSAAWFLPEQAG